MWTFNEWDTNQESVIGNTFQMERFPQGSKISLDKFIFELPSEKSYAPEEAVCDELAINGDAEDNDGEGYAYYPFYSSDWGRFNPVVVDELDENGVVFNKFYRMKYRNRSYHSMRFYPNTKCFVKGYVYTVSLRIRVDKPFDFYMKFVGINANGDWTHPLILNNPNRVDPGDGWKTFSQLLLIDDYFAGMTDIRVEIVGTGVGSDGLNGYDHHFLDVDDISIKYKSGVSDIYYLFSMYLFILNNTVVLIMLSVFSSLRTTLTRSLPQDSRLMVLPLLVGVLVQTCTLHPQHSTGGTPKMLLLRK